MDKKKYIRELSDADMPVSLTSQWNDRMALYNHLAPMIEDEIVTMLTSMPKPYAKLASTVKVTPNPVGLTISMDEYGKFVDSGTRPRVMMGKRSPLGMASLLGLHLGRLRLENGFTLAQLGNIL
jgi:hypothetical protein